MRFPFREIHQFTDAQRNFEYLETHGDFAQTANNLSDLANIATARTNLGFASGEATVTFASSVSCTPLVVTHGLGRVPNAILLTVNVGTTTTLVVAYYSSKTTTQFTIAATANVALNQNQVISWLAIG